jgi:hypothetical protein
MKVEDWILAGLAHSVVLGGAKPALTSRQLAVDTGFPDPDQRPPWRRAGKAF